MTVCFIYPLRIAIFNVNTSQGSVATRLECSQRRDDGVAAASSDGGPTGGWRPRQFYFILNHRGGALTCESDGAPDGCVTPVSVVGYFNTILFTGLLSLSLSIVPCFLTHSV